MFEYRAFVRPMSDLPLYLARMRDWPGDDWGKARDWLVANDRFRRFVLDLLRDSGPLLSRDVPDRSDVSWPSTGWTNDRNVTQMLEFLAARGEIAISRREGRQRVWDLAERVYPAGRVRGAGGGGRRPSRTSGGCAASASPGRRWSGRPASRPSSTGRRGSGGSTRPRIGAPFRGRTALLSPFDRLVHDRVRLRELFDFEYVLEMYKPTGGSAVGLLRAADAPRRPARRQARRHRRPQGRRPAGRRRARGRHASRPPCGRPSSRARRAGDVARRRPRRRRHEVEAPPLTTRTWPVTHPDADEARYTAAAPKSAS